MDLETIFRWPITPTRWRALKDYLQSQRLFPGRHVRMSKSSSGVVVAAVQGQPGSKASHPWKVSAGAAGTVSVGPGRILSYRDGTNLLILEQFLAYDGGTVTVTENGVIYGSVPAGISFDPIINIDPEFTDSAGDTGSVNVTFLRVFPDRESFEPEINVGFAATLPTTPSTFIFEIARVTFEEGAVTVTDQILTHNPTLWSFVEPS